MRSKQKARENKVNTHDLSGEMFATASISYVYKTIRVKNTALLLLDDTNRCQSSNRTQLNIKMNNKANFFSIKISISVSNIILQNFLSVF